MINQQVSNRVKKIPLPHMHVFSTAYTFIHEYGEKTNKIQSSIYVCDQDAPENSRDQHPEAKHLHNT
jgi:hypothetical protein